MSKTGQARVPSAEQQQQLFELIKQHRHPEKNTAIIQFSFKLGLRAQEIALLQIKEIVRLNAGGTSIYEEPPEEQIYDALENIK